MTPVLAGLPTICGLNELDCHSARGVTHILSILDPGWPEPEVFQTYSPRRRATLHFHDEIDPTSHLSLPRADHIEAILSFGRSLAEDAGSGEKVQFLVHCHMGISRSTAAVAPLLAQMYPEEPEDRIFARLLDIRPQAWEARGRDVPRIFARNLSCRRVNEPASAHERPRSAEQRNASGAVYNWKD